MSQWREDNNGKYKRVHKRQKRQWRRSACDVYFYKSIWKREDGFLVLVADVYTAKPKGKIPLRRSYQDVCCAREEEEEWKLKV